MDFMAKKILLIIPIFLISLSLSQASMEVENMNKAYGLGQDISPIVKLTADESFQYVFSAELSCEEYSLKYFTMPIDLTQDEQKKVEIPSLKAFDKMLGTCIIDFYLDTTLGSRIEKAWTNEFNITEDNQEVDEKNITEETIKEKEEEKDQEGISSIDEEEKNKTKMGLNVTKILSEEHEDNSIFYFILFAIALLILVVYLKLRLHLYKKRRFDINKGWRLHKRRKW